MESGQTFPDFVMQCARAMGACVEMRDDSFDAKIPKRFEPHDYHQRRTKEARAELKRLRGMNNREKIDYGKAQNKADIKRNEEWLAKETQQNTRLVEMEQKVMAWKPPTNDHVDLKKFMLEQLNISKNSPDYVSKSLTEAKAKAPMDYYSAAVKQAERDIEYNTKEHAKEVERANGRTNWIEQLRASL